MASYLQASNISSLIFFSFNDNEQASDLEVNQRHSAFTNSQPELIVLRSKAKNLSPKV